MKIYLWHRDKKEWLLHYSSDVDFKKQLADRKIIISKYAKIRNYTKISNHAEIGDDYRIKQRLKLINVYTK